MRKFLKRSFFKKVFIFLFISLYILFPPIYTIGTALENSVLGDVRVDEDILDEGISDPEWIAKPLYTYEDSVYTVDVVEKRQYTYPDNQDVRVMFTSISEEGDLTIEKITLSEDEKIELNTVDDYAWEITSSMSNGSFEYNLTLPNTSGSTDIELKYTEDGEVYESIDDVVVNEGVIYVEKLDHFTTFVVVSQQPSETRDAGRKCSIWIKELGESKCFDFIQDAIGKAREKNTIYVRKGEYKENIEIDKSITLAGFTKNLAEGPILEPVDKSQPIIKITATNVTLENFILQKAGDLGAVHIYNTFSTTIRNNRFLNNRREVWVDGSQKIYITDNVFKQNPPQSVETFGLSVGNSRGNKRENSHNTIEKNIFSNLKLAGGSPISLTGTHNNTVAGNTIESNITNWGGIRLTNSNNNRIEANTITNNNLIQFGTGNVYGIGIGLVNSTDNYVLGNRIAEHNSGIHLSTKSIMNTIEKNRIRSNWHGVVFQGNDSTQNTVTRNQIENNRIYTGVGSEGENEKEASGIYFFQCTSNEKTAIYYNNFEGTKGLAIRYNGENELNASENWWGHITGPSGAANGLGDAVSSKVLFKEWLCEPYKTDETISTSQNGVCKLKPPIQVGYKAQGSDVLLSCNGIYTNINGVSIRWSDDNYFGQDNFKYLRQYKVGNGSWRGNEIYTDLYTNYRTFGGVSGVDNIYGSRVMVFYDTNNNNQYDEGEPVSDWSNECSITFDNMPPAVKITSPKQGDLLKGITEIKGRVFDRNLSHYNIAIYPENVDVEDFSKRIEQNTKYTSEFDEKILYMWDTSNENIPDGEYQIRLAARDLAGNRDLNGDSKHVITVYVDNTPPSSTITSPNDGFITNQKIKIEGNTEDNYSVKNVTLSHTNYNSDTNQCDDDWEILTLFENTESDLPFSWAYDEWSLSTGNYCIKAQGEDKVGNLEQTSILRNIIYDTEDPTISLLNLINGVLEKIETDCGLSGLDTIQVRIGDGKWKEYIEGMNLNNLVNREPGTYTVHIEVKDRAGNIKERKATFSIPAPAPITLEEVLGAIAGPLSPQPAHAAVLGTTNRIYAQDSNAQEVEEDIEEEIEEYKEIEEFEKDDVQRKIEPTALEEERNEEEESNGIKWWIYLLILLPLLFIFFLLWKRRKDEEEDNRA
jgi:parallel beta-helix repeat protein